MATSAHHLDLTLPADRRSLIQEIDRAGWPDVVLYNASAVQVGDVLNLSWTDLQALNEVNLGAPLEVAQACLPVFREQGHGCFFVTGGGQALDPQPDWASLGMGKAAQRNLIQALVKRMSGTGVHIAQVTVCGYIQPSDPVFNADAIARIYWDLYRESPDQFRHEVLVK